MNFRPTLIPSTTVLKEDGGKLVIPVKSLIPSLINPVTGKIKYDRAEYGTDYRPEGYTGSTSLVAAFSTRMYTIDVDDYQKFEATHLGQYLLSIGTIQEIATQYRPDNSSKWHINICFSEDGLLDEDEFPTAATLKNFGYDIRANGMVRAEPDYLPNKNPLDLSNATEFHDEIMKYIEADKLAHAEQFPATRKDGSVWMPSENGFFSWSDWHNEDGTPVEGFTSDYTIAQKIAGQLRNWYYDSEYADAEEQFCTAVVDDGLPHDETWDETFARLWDFTPDHSVRDSFEAEQQMLEALGVDVDQKVQEAREKAEYWEKRNAEAEQAAQVQAVINPVPVAPGTPAPAAAPAPDVSLKDIPLQVLLNPDGEEREPKATDDAYLADEVLSAAQPVLRFAVDAGGWVQNHGSHWEEVSTKSDAQSYARTMVAAYRKSVKPVYRLEAALEEAVRGETDRRQEAADARKAEIMEEYKAALRQWESKPEEERDDADKPKKPEFPTGSYIIDPQQILDENKDRVDRLKKINQSLKSSAGTGAVASMIIAQARLNPEGYVRISDLDSEPEVFWAGGTAWDLGKSTETPVPASKFNPVHMKTASVAPAPGPHPKFTALLESMWPDEEERNYALREICGVSLWGNTSKQHPVLDSEAGRGKSTLMEVFLEILGSYAVQVSPEKLIGGRSDSSSEEAKASMIGARLVFMDEPPRGDRQSISQFNELASGTGYITAAAKYKNQVTAKTRYNFVIAQNERNRIDMNQQGVSERLVFLPIKADPEAVKRARTEWLKAKDAEAPAVLATMIVECARYQKSRLPQPLGFTVSQDEAREAGDEFSQWLLDEFEIMDSSTPARETEDFPTTDSLRKQFNEGHARPNRVKVLSRNEVKKSLEKLGVHVGTAGVKGNKRNTAFLKARTPKFAQYPY